MADLALVVNEKDTSLHMLVAGNIARRSSPAWECNAAQGREWAFGVPLGWITCQVACFASSQGVKCDHQLNWVLSKPTFPICNTVCSTGVGKRPVDESTAEPNVGLHFTHKSLQLT